MAEPTEQILENAITTGLSGPAVHVSDRFTNSHRKTSSPRPTAFETHLVASQKEPEGTGITRKDDPNSLHPHLQGWLEEDNVLTGPTITPTKTCSTVTYRRIKEGWGVHLDEHTARGTWSLPESKLLIDYLELKAVFSAVFPGPLLKQDSTCSNR